MTALRPAAVALALLLPLVAPGEEPAIASQPPRYAYSVQQLPRVGDSFQEALLALSPSQPRWVYVAGDDDGQPPSADDPVEFDYEIEVLLPAALPARLSLTLDPESLHVARVGLQINQILSADVLIAALGEPERRERRWTVSDVLEGRVTEEVDPEGLAEMLFYPQQGLEITRHDGMTLTWLHWTSPPMDDGEPLDDPVTDDETAQELAEEQRRLLLDHNLPPTARDCLEAHPRLAVDGSLNPFYLGGDFDGDGRADHALHVHRAEVTGILVCLSGHPDQLLGAGEVFEEMVHLDWMDAWTVHPRGDVGPGVEAGPPPTLQGDAILAMRSESGSGLIYWDGRGFAWYQQGD